MHSYQSMSRSLRPICVQSLPLRPRGRDPVPPQDPERQARLCVHAAVRGRGHRGQEDGVRQRGEGGDGRVRRLLAGQRCDWGEDRGIWLDADDRCLMRVPLFWCRELWRGKAPIMPQRVRHKDLTVGLNHVFHSRPPPPPQSTPPTRARASSASASASTRGTGRSPSTSESWAGQSR